MRMRVSPEPTDALKRLDDLGLSPTEAALYLAGLRSPGASANELGRLANIKRPTTYYGLQRLSERGLVATTGTERKQHYTMADPTHLTRLVDQKMAQLEHEKKQLLPWLETLRQIPSATLPGLHILHYEGIEGVKTALNEGLYCKTLQWSVIAPYKNTIRSLDRAFQETYLRTRAQRGLEARTLWERSPKNGRPSPEQRAQRHPRYLPKDLEGRFQSMLILFDTKALILSGDTLPSAVLIDSPAIYSLLVTMFDGLWSLSKEA